VTTTPSLIKARIPRWMIAVGDQGVVAIGNLLMSITVTRVAGVATLGRFTLVATTILLCMTVSRILVADPWLASRTAARVPGPELRWLILVNAMVTSVIVAGVVFLCNGGDHHWYLACAIGPVFIVQDFGRYVAFRGESPAGALSSDASALVAGIATFLVFVSLGSADLMSVLLSWLVGITVGAVIASSRLTGPLGPRGAKTYWVRYCRPLAMKLALDGVGYIVGVSGSLYLLAYLATQHDVGTVRIVQTMFSPAVLTITGLNMWLVPYLAHHGGAQSEHARRRLTTWMAIGSASVLGVAVLLGPWLVHLVFGLSRTPPLLAICLAGLSPCAMAVAAPWVASARVSGNFTPLAWTRAGAAVITWTGLLTLTSLRAPTGYLGLLALQDVLIALVAIFVGTRTPMPHGASDEARVADAAELAAAELVHGQGLT
jgi:hypothetical protein